MESELDRLASRVVARRKEKGWPTRQAFADAIDLTYRVLTDLENGVRRLGPKAYAVIELALEWRPGSIDNILAGGEPRAITPENSLLASRVRHPSRTAETIELLEDEDMASLLQKLLIEGHVDPYDRQRIQDALDDADIRRFPQLFESLSRAGKLRVVEFGKDVSTQEYLAKEGINTDDMEATQEQAASSETPSHKKTDADSADDMEPSSAAAAADAITAAAVAELEVNGVDNNREQA